MTKVSFEEGYSAFAIDANNGSVCAVAPSKDLVSLYPALSKGHTAGRIDRTVGNGPTCVIYHEYNGKSYFIVGCQGNPAIWLLDASTLAVVKTIPVKDPPIALSCALLSQSPFAFYGTSDSLGAISLLDLSNHENLVRTMPPGSFNDICVSSDGKRIYGRCPSTTPCPASIYSVAQNDGGSPKVLRMDLSSFEATSFHADPFGPWVACNHFGLDSDEMKPYFQTADIESPTSCFFRKSPVVVSLDQQTLRFYSHNSGRQLASLDLSAEASVTPIDTGSNPFWDETILVDEVNDKLLLCNKSSCIVVDIADLNLSKEPVLGVTFDAGTVWDCGVPASMPLTKINPAESVELSDPLPGMKIDGDNFDWTPGESEIGKHVVRLRISDGGFQRTQSLPIRAQRTSLKLPFDPTQTVISENGKLALILGHFPSPQNNAEPGVVGDSVLLVVDLDAQTVIAQRELPEPLRAIALDNNHAYGAEFGSDAIYRFSVKDLKAETKIFVSSPVIQMSIVHNKMYWVTKDNNMVTVYLLPDLKPSPERLLPSIYQDTALGLPRRIGNEWSYRGAIYTDQMDKVIRVKNAIGLMEVNPSPRNLISNFDQYDLNPQGYGTWWQGGTLTRIPSQHLGGASGSLGVFLPDLPAIATMNETQGSPLERYTIIDFDELASASRQARVTLTHSFEFTNYAGANMPALLATVRRVVAIAHQKLYVIPTNTLDRSFFPPPLRLECTPGVPIIDPSKPSSIKFTASNMQSPIEYSLETERKEIEIDKTNGNVAIDGNALAAAAMEMLLRNISLVNNNMLEFRGLSPNLRSAEDRVELYVDSVADRYSEITGSKPEAVPVAVRLDAIAVDSLGQKAGCSMIALLNIPKSSVVAGMKAGIDGPQAVPVPLSDNEKPSGGVTQKDVDDLRARLAELAKHNDELEARNKLLQELIERKK